jgi:REG-2-like HAD superfamily hydrolase
MLLRGVTFDAVGVLIQPREPVGVAYHRALARYDKAAAAATSPAAIGRLYSRAYNSPRLYSAGSSSRFHPDFWMGIVRASTGSSCPRVFEHVYEYYAQPSAWRVLPGASDALRRLRGAGLLTAVLSNNDARLRPLLDGLGLGNLVDAVIVSAEVGAEKPSPVIFDHAVDALGLPKANVVHVGDDRLLDVWGGRDAGILSLLLGPQAGSDVRSLPALADLLLRHYDPTATSDGADNGGVPFYFMDRDEDEDEDDLEE